MPGQGRQRGEGDAVFLVRLLDAGRFQVFEHHLPEILPPGFRLGEFMDEAVVQVAGDEAMRRQALGGERASDTDTGIVGVGLIVEVFGLGLGSNRFVDLLLPGNVGLPPLGV